MTCTCKLQGKGKYPNTISQSDLPLDFDCVGRADYEKVEGADIYGQEKESVMDPLHPDLPLNVFKC